MSNPIHNALKHETLCIIQDEVKSARDKFPNPTHLFAALSEEVGELAKALLDENDIRVWEEAVQVVAMGIRIMEEGDPAFDELRKERGLYKGLQEEEIIAAALKKARELNQEN